jgi:hypothetical protein
MGIAAHEAIAGLLRADDPVRALPAVLETLGPLERNAVERVLRNHLALDTAGTDGHPIAYNRMPERTAGVVFSTKDLDDRPTAVALLTRLDATGRELDQTPAVIEHKTGGGQIPYELDLCAVAGWHLAMGRDDVERIAVHHHWLAPAGPSGCQRTVFDQAAIEASTHRLAGLAQTVADWDPADALSPAPQPMRDPYCHQCPFELRCARFGGPR